ncbi:ubiquinone menaquinone biosynthesis C-methyltransferase [Apiospora marii]|uniref:Ubiquinone menaquinone biosynthesis C-methyltransferase n=1 Tax=Apiospora marii TaxID=335849 RepID=A0ABR1RM60_9PEZI
MENNNPTQDNYDEQAKAYSQFISTPLGTLEKELFELCIRDCDGMKVLDMGGGTGLRARDALRAGAGSVDVVDISAEMMRHGQAYEKSIGRDRITWYQADPYDMVIANGIFEHAQNLQEFEAMWRNAAAYLKPGGRLVSNRNDPRSAAARGDGQYGVVFDDRVVLDDRITFRYRALTEPTLVFESNALEAHYAGSFEIPGQYFEDFQNVPFEETPVVQADREFWKGYLEDPILYIFTARKKS